MKRVRFFISILLLIFLTVTTVGCGNSQSYGKDIYNDNSKIAKQGDIYSFVKKISNANNNEVSIKFEEFNGTETLWYIDSKEEGAINLDYKTEIDNGFFKLVLITPDNEVITIFENSQTGSKPINIQKGESRIKIVGNDAKGEIQLLIKGSEDIEIQSKEL